MTAKSLNALTRRELAQKAKKKGITGWHGMRKNELVEALLEVGRQRHRQAGRNGADVRGAARNGSKTNGTAKTNAASNGSAERRGPERLSSKMPTLEGSQDTLVARPLDAQWIELTWALSARMVGRAEASLGADWHAAVPVIRVIDVSGSEQTGHVKDVEITGDADKWYVPVDDPSRTYRMHIGYLARTGQFFSLAKSRRVVLPKPGSSSRLSRPGVLTRKSTRVPIPSSLRDHGSHEFEVEAELVVHGHANPHARVSLLGEEVLLDEDGYFSIRISLPEGRQVIPAVSVTPTGDEQRTIVLAIERNTKTLEPESLIET